MRDAHTQNKFLVLKSREDEIESRTVFHPGTPRRASTCVGSGREGPYLIGSIPSCAKGGDSALTRVEARALGAHDRMSPQKTEARRVPPLLAGLRGRADSTAVRPDVPTGLRGRGLCWGPAGPRSPERGVGGCEDTKTRTRNRD